MLKDKLIHPWLDVDLEYYDLHVKHRDDTDDEVTVPGGRGHQEAQGRGQVRHHHSQRRPGEGIRSQGAVEEPQRHHPGHAGRHRVPRPHPGPEREAGRQRPGPSPSSSAVTPTATCTRTPRSPFRVRGGPSWSFAPTAAKSTERIQSDPGVFGSRHPAGHAQHRRLHRELCPGLLHLRPGPEHRRLVLHQGHHLQDLRRPVPGDLPAGASRRSSQSSFKLRASSTSTP